MNERNIERILDVLQFSIQHYGKTFMDDDIYKEYPNVTKNVIELLVENEVLTSTMAGNSFDETNIENFRAFLSDLQDEVDELKISEKEKNDILSKINFNLNFNFNMLNI